MKNLLGSNQYKTKNSGLKRETWITIIFLLAFIALLFYIGISTHHEKVISPLSMTTAFAFVEYKVPELAPLPERQRNIELIKYVFGSNADSAIQVFTCESGLRTNALNPNNDDGYPDVGIAQIHVTSFQPFTPKEMENPLANLYQAKNLFDHRGWEPWNSSRSCWGNNL